MFDTYQLSRFLGRPARLFRFERQNLVWRYTNAPIDLESGGYTYYSAQIERDDIKQTIERAKDKLKIRFAYLRDPYAPIMPVTQPLGDNWTPYPPSDPVRVICMATHIGDTDPPKTEWLGICNGAPEFTDVELTLTCMPGSALASTVNQGPKWQVGCWKVPYSTGPRGCGMLLDDFEVPAVLTDVDGLVLTADAFGTAPLTLAGGWMQWVRADGLVDRRSILLHAGTSIRLQFGALDLAPAMDVSAWPHCEQTWNACSIRFPDPQRHYGGAIYKPITDPTQDSMSWG